MPINFAKHLAKIGKSPRTISEYRARLNNYYTYLVEELNKLEIRDALTVDIYSYKEYLERGEQSMNTINGKLNVVSNYYRFLVNKGAIEKSPVPADIYVVDEAEEVPLLTNDQKAILEDYIDRLPNQIGTAIWIMYGAGLRCGEIVSLIKNDLIFYKNRAFVAVRRHGEEQNRVVPILNARAANAIYSFKQLLNVNNDKTLFTINKSLLHRHALSFTDKTGIPIYSHILRYNIGNYLRKNNFSEDNINLYLGETPTKIPAIHGETSDLDSEFHKSLLPITPKIKPDEERGLINE